MVNDSEYLILHWIQRCRLSLTNIEAERMSVEENGEGLAILIRVEGSNKKIVTRNA